MLLSDIAERVLPNGLKAICLRKQGAPIASVQVWYRTGSAHETPGIRGISHFLEHMMFRGSANVKSEEHSRRISDVGGHCNAFTAEDVTAFTNSVPREFTDTVLSLEADRMSNLSLDRGLFDTERNVIIEEFHTYMNNPLAKAFLEFRHEFYRNHAYETSPLGTIEDLRTVTADQARQYYDRWYRPDNAVIVAVGDIGEQQFLESVERHFGQVRARSDGPVNGAPPAGRAERSHRMKRRVDFDVPVLIVGYPAPSSSHVDAVALEILQIVATGGETSRLHREVVRRQSVAVMAAGMNHLLKESGMSVFFAAFTPDTPVARVEKAIEHQIAEIRHHGITVEEMEKVKNSTLTSRTFELYSAENICQRIGYGEAMEGDYRLWVKRIEALKELDRDRLIAVARMYWDDSKRHVLHLQPKRVNPVLFAAGLFRRFFRRRAG